MKPLSTHVGLALSTTALLALTACGGDGDSTAAAPPAATATTFSGTAATGRPIVKAAIAITCAAGSGTTTASASGAYTATLTGITLPCALRATSTDGATVLYSVTSATAAATQVANITQLTHLVVASLTGGDPAAFYAALGASATTEGASSARATAIGLVTPANVAAAQSTVLTTLAGAGITLTGLSDLIGGSLTAGSGAGYDGILDQLAIQLAGIDSNPATALAAFTTVVATASPVVPPTTVDHTPRLPASQLLKTAASNCAALRSGTYTVINPVNNSTLAQQIGNVSFNAATLTWTDTNVVDGGGQMTATGPCSYAIDTDSYTVSPAGILMGTNTEAGVRGLSIVIPTQTIAVSELAGNWNALGFQKNDAGTAFVAETISANISSTGAFTNLVECVGARLDDVCTTSTTTINLSSNSAGGFDWVGSGTHTWTERAFAYRAGSGDLMLVTLGGGGSVAVWTKQRSLGLHTVGESLTGGSSVRITNQLVASGPLSIFPFGATVIAVDAATGTETRTQQTDTGAPDYNDSVVINSPRAGYNFRAAGSTTATDSRTVLVRERTSLPIRGMGVSFQSVPHVSSFQMSVD